MSPYDLWTDFWIIYIEFKMDNVMDYIIISNGLYLMDYI